MTHFLLSRAAVILLMGCSVSACLTLPPVLPNPSNPISNVAVLPVVNNTNDVDGPALVREWIVTELENHFYEVESVKRVDRILKDRMGLTLGSQLNMAQPEQFCETLKVTGLLYSSLEEFTYKITGVYNVKRARVRMKLVDCQGLTVWKNGIGVKRILYAGTIGALASLGSTAQDSGAGDELPPFLGDAIAAPWIELQAEDAGGLIQGTVRTIVDKASSKATGGELESEVIHAVRASMNGYIIKGFSTEKYGEMIPSGHGS